jgi:hypothetical protein
MLMAQERRSMAADWRARREPRQRKTFKESLAPDNSHSLNLYQDSKVLIRLPTGAPPDPLSRRHKALLFPLKGEPGIRVPLAPMWVLHDVGKSAWSNGMSHLVNAC